MNDRPPTDHVRAPTCQAVDFGSALKLLAQSVWKLWIIVHNLHTPARVMHANQVKSSVVYFTSSGVASKQEKWDCNPNWTLFAEICAEERGDLRDVLVESGASSFSRATIVRDATVNPCGSNLLVKNRFGRRSLRVCFSQGVLSRNQRVWSPKARGQRKKISSTMAEFVSPGAPGNQLQFLDPLFELWANPVVGTLITLLLYIYETVKKWPFLLTFGWAFSLQRQYNISSMLNMFFLEIWILILLQHLNRRLNNV